MKLLWTGTDSLMLINYSMRRRSKRIYWWLFRRFIRVAELFIQSHACISDNIATNLSIFDVRKPIERVNTTLNYNYKMNKMEHDKFTVLYYFPKSGDMEFHQWLYGWDIFLQVKEAFPNIKFLVVDGTYEMRYVYPFVDFYLRPNRHDGPSRMRLECEIQEIPYYWTRSNPSAEDAIKRILYVRENYKV